MVDVITDIGSIPQCPEMHLTYVCKNVINCHVNVLFIQSTSITHNN